MHDFLDNIENLSNYSFKLGIGNVNVMIALSEDNDEEEKEKVSADDFLRMLENGSPLHNIVATRPIEQTVLTMSSTMRQTYDDCIREIIQNNITQSMLDTKMINLANQLKIRLQLFVDNSIRQYVTCDAFYKQRKIN